MIEATDAHVWTARRRCLSPAARVLAVMEAGRAHSGGRGAGEGLSADAVAAVAASVAAAAAAVPTVGGGAPFADEADAHFGVRVSARALWLFTAGDRLVLFATGATTTVLYSDDRGARWTAAREGFDGTVRPMRMITPRP